MRTVRRTSAADDNNNNQFGIVDVAIAFAENKMNIIIHSSNSSIIYPDIENWLIDLFVVLKSFK